MPGNVGQGEFREIEPHTQEGPLARGGMDAGRVGIRQDQPAVLDCRVKRRQEAGDLCTIRRLRLAVAIVPPLCPVDVVPFVLY